LKNEISQTPRKTTQSPLLRKTPEKPTQNTTKILKEKTKKRYLVVIISEDMAVKDKFCW
jgi:hypothetical protein